MQTRKPAPLDDLGQLIPITDSEGLRRINCHLAPATLRKMSSQGTHPRLMLTLCRRIYLIADEWRRILSEAVADRNRRAARLEAQAVRLSDPTKPRRGRPRKIALPLPGVTQAEPAVEGRADHA